MRFLQHDQIVGLKQPPKTQTRTLVKWYPKHQIGNRGSGWYEEYLAANDLGPEYDGFRGNGVYVLEWDYPEDTWVGPEDYDDWIKQAKWLIGKTYAVQRPDGKTIGRTPPVRAIRQEKLGDISEEDCLAEGVICRDVLSLESKPMETYRCPICEATCGYASDAFACLWNHCGGNWERDKDKQCWVLDWEER